MELQRRLNYKRHWSDEEADPVLDYFKTFIRTSIRNKTGFKDLPKQEDILTFLQKHKQIERPWKQIKDFVRNHVVSQRRMRAEDPLLAIMLGIQDKVDDFNEKKQREQDEREKKQQDEEKRK
uniref:Uncharacterized protein n=1 Tax=Cacopsylla melanoneura TaxID=428564 RepID=A0A8D8YQ91_9HEMI